MKRIPGTKRELLELEQLADDGYSKFRIELDKPEQERDYFLTQTAYESLHRHLLRVVGPAHTYRTFRKGEKREDGKRASRVQRFIEQIILMYDPGVGMLTDKFEIKVEPDTEDGMGGLKAFINTNDVKSRNSDGGTKNGEMFRRTQVYATELREKGRFDFIFNGLTHIRGEKYKK